MSELNSSNCRFQCPQKRFFLVRWTSFFILLPNPKRFCWSFFVSISLFVSHLLSNWKKLAHLIVVICKRKSFITSCLDETTVQMKKRRKRRRRKSSFTHSQISFESFNSQRIRERIRRRNYLKKGNLSPRRVVEISGQPISNWKKDDLLGLYDLVDCDRTGRPVYKVKRPFIVFPLKFKS